MCLCKTEKEPDDTIAELVKEPLRKFIKDYLAANPNLKNEKKK